MDEQERELSAYRISEAKRCIRSAHMLIRDEDYKGAANRSYYAIFHCMRAVLAVEGVDFAKHSGIISYFRKEYIRTEIFPKETSAWISELFDLRNMSDYDDFYIASKEDVKIQIERANQFLKLTEKYLKEADRN